ncbi:hypothetical protein [Faecalibacterium sp. An77]|uniref:hypothetical protein n=1 Tax=Faecalibacterium sp. An77 TaxID=1965655 RepID=UPI0013023DD5|nr:hypothetical protein [Faecalibacterium sp. An77]
MPEKTAPPGCTGDQHLAAALYAISTPLSKLLLQDVAPIMMAGAYFASTDA